MKEEKKKKKEYKGKKKEINKNIYEKRKKYEFIKIK
jgi:hypothetical protein